ncbi:TPA: hypothetical protein PXQ72_003818 [Yersinia enterocolitica]|nr:hypothetical protein [Yersinia enterocolitica]HDL8219183.1 hypothetical protein [Yersinia enterocolitica]HDL8223838.1 hypothetical protein [Yersinia enterocolitica]
MNNLEVLKAKKPENLKSLSSIAAGYVTDNNTGGYYVGSSQKTENKAR